MTTPSPDAEKTARIESDARRAPRQRGGDAQFAPGTIIVGRYRIASILGSGGMGEVYRADDTKLGQQVALKFLPQRLARDPILLERLHEEVRLGRQIAHPNVCRIYDIVDWDDAHFVAMEYVDGEDLSRLLHRIGRLASDKAVDIARGIAAGLAAAHGKGILHRDLKPANVMIDSHGDARIMDFGLASGAGEDDGTISGTPAYMAPEQIDGQPASVQSDLYALGLVMYELFTGKRAHNARTLPERARDITSEITTPSSVIRDIDPAVERVILRCLSHDPAQRPHSAREVIGALPGGDPLAAAMAAGETPSPRFIAAAPIAGSLRPAAAWTLLGAIVALVATLFAFAISSRAGTLLGLSAPPEVQAERARQLLRGFGIPAQDFSSYGFDDKELYGSWIDQNDRSPQRWEPARRSYPLTTFWFREQRKPLVGATAIGTPQPGVNEPPLLDPGSVAIELDGRGRLFSLTVVPSPGWPARSPDWKALLAAAGLRSESLEPATPKLIPPAFADARAAWSGRLEDGTPIGIEAAMLRGIPVFFRITAPWDSTDEWSLSFGPRFDFVRSMLFAIALVVGAVLAWRNVRMRRGDRVGAVRVGVVIFLLELLMRLLVADHEVAAAHEMVILVAALSGALLRAAFLALIYLALEPYLRRRWPDRLVSWSRLLAGTWRDPMVGRDTMIGILGGIVHTTIIITTNLVDELLTTGAFVPGTASPSMFAHAAFGLAHVADSSAAGVRWAFAMMVFLMLLTVVFRRRPLAIAVFFFLYFGMMLAGSMDPKVFFSFALLAGTATFVVSRYGLLAAVAMHAAFFTTFMFPLPDAFTWYTLRALVPIGCVLATAIWAFRTSLGNQPAFGAASLLDE